MTGRQVAWLEDKGIGHRIDDFGHDFFWRKSRRNQGIVFWMPRDNAWALTLRDRHKRETHRTGLTLRDALKALADHRG